MLIVIDVFSRKLYARPIKTKGARNVDTALNDIIQEARGLRGGPGARQSHPNIKTIQSDNGVEFLNKDVQDLLQSFGIDHQTSELEDHSVLGIVDRVSRTIREMLQKHFEVQKTSNWVDNLPVLIAAYNNRTHSTLGKAPAQVTDNDVEILIQNIDKASNIKQPNIKPGDKVRKLMSRNAFTKGTKQRFSREVYTVESVAQVNARLTNGQKVRIERLVKVPDALETDEPEERSEAKPTLKRPREESETQEDVEVVPAPQKRRRIVLPVTEGKTIEEAIKVFTDRHIEHLQQKTKRKFPNISADTLNDKTALITFLRAVGEV